MKTIGIIPARGGSKRIPRKNTLDLDGKPLVAWTIHAAKESRLDRVIVSTEDDEIAIVARNYLAEVIKRPEYLATDTAKTVDVVAHALSEINEPFDLIAVLQPTSPFRTAYDIDAAIELQRRTRAKVVVSVYEDRRVEWPAVVCHKRYVLNGAIYLVMPEVIICCDLSPRYAEPYIMPECRSLDIDDWYDLYLARLQAKYPFRTQYGPYGETHD